VSELGNSDMGSRSITAHTVDVKLYTCVDWERNVKYELKP